MTTNTGLPARKTLHRSDNRMIAGVCSGVAEYFGIDVTLVRVIAAILVLSGGTGLAIYVIAWLVMPDTSGTVQGTRLVNKLRSPGTSGNEAGTAATTPSGDTTHEPPAA
jgi:phage shock protein PspC (stress-responsive transcriptional regulator)